MQAKNTVTPFVDDDLKKSTRFEESYSHRLRLTYFIIGYFVFKKKIYIWSLIISYAFVIFGILCLVTFFLAVAELIGSWISFLLSATGVILIILGIVIQFFLIQEIKNDGNEAKIWKILFFIPLCAGLCCPYFNE